MTRVALLVYLLACVGIVGFSDAYYAVHAFFRSRTDRTVADARFPVTLPDTLRSSKQGIVRTGLLGINRLELSRISDALLLEERKKLVNDFVHQVQNSLHDGSFVSLTIRGPSKKSIKDTTTMDPNEIRGCLRMLTGRLINIKGSKRLQVTFKYHGATDVAKNWELDGVGANLASVFVFTNEDVDYQERLANEGFVESEWGSAVWRASTVGTLTGIQTASLETITTRWELDVGAKQPRLSRRLPLRMNISQIIGIEGSEAPDAAPQAHDRAKVVPLNASADFLRALGVTDGVGKPRTGMASKLRQCQKFVEIVDHLIEDALSSVRKHQNKEQTIGPAKQISVVDMGCGRGYLTFSLHAFLQSKYKNENVTILSKGVDLRPKLIEEVSTIARTLGTDFVDSLRFEVGTIEDHLGRYPHSMDQSGWRDRSYLDVLIALHACDTATDDALWSGIARRAHVIVVAPCCHREVRSQLDRHVRQSPNHVMADVLRHAIYRERTAETVTDSLRALLLEIAGYAVQVFEFVGGEHTSKNVLITAVQRDRNHSDAELANLRERLQALASLYGIQEHRLARWMKESLVAGNDSPSNAILSRRMHPLQ